MGYLPAGCLPPARRLLGAGGPGPAMSAHLAMPPYLPYPGAVRYGDYYWLSPGSMDAGPAEEAPAADVLPFPAAEKTPSHPGTRPGRARGAIGPPSAGERRLCPPTPLLRRGWGAMPAAGAGRGCQRPPRPDGSGRGCQRRGGAV